MKVIQILYSFLLVEKQFTLESNPSAPTKEKRFAYSLYLDLLVLIIRIAERVERRRGEHPLDETRFVSRLKIDDQIKSLLRQSQADFCFNSLVETLADRVKESGVYKNFLKDVDRDNPTADENVWRDLLKFVILPDPQLNALIETRQNYTLKGVERMHDMLQRTLVNFLASQDNVNEVLKALEKGLDKSRELYFRLLWLPVELTDMQDRIIDDNRHKFIKSEEDLNPNMRFVDNEVVRAIRENPAIHKYISDNKISWEQEDPVMMRHLLREITSSDIYTDYMMDPVESPCADGDLWRALFKHLIVDNPEFLESMEERSVFWNDDLEIISTFVLKTLRRLEEGHTAGAVLDKYKDEEDARFGEQLMRAVYKNKETYRLYIDEALRGGNWESERLAFMDMVVLEAALAEIMNFPKIPLTASINEYIEIAKSYSTSRSGAFVNGILGAVVASLRKQGILRK